MTLPVLKTYKLFIGGQFPRSESGRSLPVTDATGKVVAHACRASRKDLREAVVAARKAQPGWASASGYNRGQVLYRFAEMLEAKRKEFAELLQSAGESGAEADAEVTDAVDRMVYFAGWTDKLHHVLGGQNAVVGPYWNLTTPMAQGVVGVVCPTERPLLGFAALAAPVLASGNAVVLISPAEARVVSTIGEVLATSDVPPGVVNVLTGLPDELCPVLAAHRDVDGVLACGVGAALAGTLRQGVAENLKRVRICESAEVFAGELAGGTALLEGHLEFKTVWHPTGI